MIGCKKCGECCKWMAFDVGMPEADLNEDMKDWCEYHHVKLVIREHKVIFFIPCRCDHLTSSNLCDIYDQRPASCRILPKQGMSIWPTECKYFDYEDK